MPKPVKLNTPSNESISLGDASSLFVIAGPCVIESRDLCLRIAEHLKSLAQSLGITLIFKASFDKANRTSSTGYRGLGIDEGLAVLQEVRSKFNLCVISDVHLPEQVPVAAQVLDILQIPAFLCRQTDLLEAAGASGRAVMIKKGQFLHPSDMEFAARKVRDAGSESILFCERGSCFGYRELIVDFRSLALMAELGHPVVFDATHSVQIMGGAHGASSGQRKFVPLLARAAVAAGVNGVFIETHPQPDTAPSDGPNMIPLEEVAPLLEDLLRIANLPLSTRAQQTQGT